MSGIEGFNAFAEFPVGASPEEDQKPHFSFEMRIEELCRTEQPIFYPVLTEEYATQIARDWNTKDERSGFAGFVLRFSVRTEFLRKYEVHVVGSSNHREYWIPAAELPQFNSNIVGGIEVIAEFERNESGG